MSLLETVEWHHGGMDGSCMSDGPTPVSKLGKKRMKWPIPKGLKGHKQGKVGVHADCPKCGQWIRIGTEGGVA